MLKLMPGHQINAAAMIRELGNGQLDVMDGGIRGPQCQVLAFPPVSQHLVQLPGNADGALGVILAALTLLGLINIKSA